MKKNMVVGIAMAVGILSFGALSAFADGSDSNLDYCYGNQANHQFNKESAGLVSQIKEKKSELKDLLYTDASYDINKANKLEKDVKQLEGKINTTAHMHGMESCSNS